MESAAETVAKRRRIRELEVMVAENIRETHDTSTLVLFTGNDHLEYKAGHFLTLDPHDFPGLERFTAYLEDVKAKREPARAYSMCSAPHEKQLAITVKEERYVSGLTKYPPLLSPLLVHRIPRGTRLVITGFSGPYVLPDDIESRTERLVHVCAGSGIVPNFSILKQCLVEHPQLKHTLIYSNKTWKDVIFRRQLQDLQAEHPDRLAVVHAITRDPDAVNRARNVRTGRINEALLKELIPDPTAVVVYCCGPGITRYDREAAKEKGEAPAPRFLESALASLAAIGVPDDNVRREMYG
ncbi:MAG: oxidoreductase [Planctomycetia bacterium]|nr:oxidoreductase [Planctomycetia bacterium]